MIFKFVRTLFTKYATLKYNLFSFKNYHRVNYVSRYHVAQFNFNIFFKLKQVLTKIVLSMKQNSSLKKLVNSYF